MDHSRHQNLFLIPPGFSVTLIGAGGIGAVTALTLAKMGLQVLQIFDDDDVAEENIATQLHKPSDIGKPKVVALRDTLYEFSDEILAAVHAERVTAFTQLHSELIISAVDSITVRKQIWAGLILPTSKWNWYLDARMGAEEYQHFLVSRDPMDTLAYGLKLDTLNESDVPDVPCTEKATFFTAMMAAGHIGKVVRDIVRNEARPHRLVHNIPTNWLQTFPY